MQTMRRVSTTPHVSYMSPGINKMNARSWETLVISMNSGTTKDHMHYTIKINKFNRNQQNNAIVNSTVDEILLKEKRKVSAEREAPENIESHFDENEMYQIDNMSLEDT